TPIAIWEWPSLHPFRVHRFRHTPPPRMLIAWALAASLPASHAFADSFWNGGSGEWTDPINWSPSIPNGADAIAVFQTGVSSPTSTITLAAPVAIGQLT